MIGHNKSVKAGALCAREITLLRGLQAQKNAFDKWKKAQKTLKKAREYSEVWSKNHTWCNEQLQTFDTPLGPILGKASWGCYIIELSVEGRGVCVL